jgi:uncharacterized membrane protein YfcA
LPGAFAGTAFGQAVSGSTPIAAFALILFAAASAMWRKATAGARTGPSDTPAASCPPPRLARGLAAGSLMGLMTGFFGVGGGFLIVPTLTLALALSMRRRSAPRSRSSPPRLSSRSPPTSPRGERSISPSPSP